MIVLIYDMKTFVFLLKFYHFPHTENSFLFDCFAFPWGKANFVGIPEAPFLTQET